MSSFVTIAKRLGTSGLTLARGVRRAPWWLAVSLLALGARLAYVLLVDPPIAYSTAAGYLSWALDLSRQKDVLGFILNSDEWRDWNRVCTLAPLYQVFLLGVIKLFGAHLLPIRIVQCIFGALAAVSVGVIGRALAGSRGTWAGVAMALFWPGVQLPAETLTENLHTTLFVAAIAVIILALGWQDPRKGAALAAAGGILLGLAALTRSVSFAFIPLAALWIFFEAGWRRGLKLGSVIVLAGMAMVAPWTLRNLRLYGELVPIETAGVYGIWNDNAFVSRSEYQRQIIAITASPRLGERARTYLKFTRRNLAREPWAFAWKVQSNLQHLLRPDGLRTWLVTDAPAPTWQPLADVLLDDALFLAAQGLFIVFVLAAARSPSARLVLIWTAYYVVMLVVVFHTEIRYRSVLTPFLLAGACAGWAALRGAARPRPWRIRLGLALGILLIVANLIPYVLPASRVLSASVPLWKAKTAITQGRFDDAQREVAVAAARDPGSPRPWRLYGRWLTQAGQPLLAARAYENAAGRRLGRWLTAFVPPLLREAGRAQSPAAGRPTAAALPVNQNDWSLLEAAWRDLPPPRTSCVQLGVDDVGAVRDFFPPTSGGRWTRHTARVRLRPAQGSSVEPVVIVMGSPEPSPLTGPVVTVHISGAAPERLTLDRVMRPFRLNARPKAGAPVDIEIVTPTWMRSGWPADVGVKVARVCVGAEAARALDTAPR
jgi:4-amino-4-deoxy-L-arabinose transferase-like glycosyltransferase